MRLQQGTYVETDDIKEVTITFILNNIIVKKYEQVFRDRNNELEGGG